VEGVVRQDTTWSGDVLVMSDVLVPDGVTLTIAPGTRVMFAASESTKIEPMFLSMQCELLVRGALIARGAKDRPILFMPAPEGLNDKKPARGDWGGVIFDGAPASRSVLSHAELTMADSAIAAYGSSPTVTDCKVEDSKYGVVLMGGSAPRLTGCAVTGCEYGVVSGRGAKARMEDCTVVDNEHDFISRD
jgi:parallel beta-helix repeat protein